MSQPLDSEQESQQDEEEEAIISPSIPDSGGEIDTLTMGSVTDEEQPDEGADGGTFNVALEHMLIWSTCCFGSHNSFIEQVKE